jgi:hypothetical protein
MSCGVPFSKTAHASRVKSDQPPLIVEHSCVKNDLFHVLLEHKHTRRHREQEHLKTEQNMKIQIVGIRSPAEQAGTSSGTFVSKRKLGSTTLTVAILVLFFVISLTLAALLGLLLTGLAALLLPVLSRLTTVLTLSDLTTLLALFIFFRIVCHELLLLKHGPCRAGLICRLKT